MLVNLLSSEELRREFEVTFSYRHTARYAVGLQERVRLEVPVHPLGFRESSDLFVREGVSRAPLHRIGRALSRQLLTLPLLLREIVVLYRLFRRIGPDLVHVNNGGYPGALSSRAATVAARLAGVPRVMMVINNFAEGYDRIGRWLERPLDRAVASSTDLFVAGSRASADRLGEVLRLEAGRVRSIPNGADLRAPSETVPETRARLALDGYAGVIFGIVALMEPRKGHRVLLEAVRRLAHVHGLGPDRFRLVLLGDGLLRSQLERQARDLGLAAHCHFLGEEPNGMNVIAALDVLVLPSVAHEDFPNVVLEAMGTGKAVIASRIAGTPEQIADGESGVLVPPGDAGALAGAMLAMLDDPGSRAAMGAAGRRRYTERFTARAAVERFTECYRSLLASRRRADAPPAPHRRSA